MTRWQTLWILPPSCHRGCRSAPSMADIDLQPDHHGNRLIRQDRRGANAEVQTVLARAVTGRVERILLLDTDGDMGRSVPSSVVPLDILRRLEAQLADGWGELAQ